MLKSIDGNSTVLLQHGNRTNQTKERRTQMLKNFVRDESGQGLAEYALILALIAIVVIAALRILGTATSNKLNDMGTQLNAA